MNKSKASSKPLRHKITQSSRTVVKGLKQRRNRLVSAIPGWFERVHDYFSTLYSKKTEEEDQEKQLWQLPKTLILEDLEVRQTFLFTSSVLCGLLFVLFVWANVATIDEMALSTGRVITISRIGDIQHLEGGIIKTVDIREGELVNKNQLLATLDATAALSELKEQEAKQLSLRSDIKRLHSFLELKHPEQILMSANNVFRRSSNESASVADIVSGDQALLQLESLSEQNQQNIVLYQIEQQKDEVQKFEKQLTLNNLNLKLGTEEFAVYQKLMKKEYISRTEFLAKQRELVQLENEQVNINYALAKARNTLKEYEYKLKDLTTTLQKEAVDKLTKATDELFQVQFTLKKLKDRVSRIAIRSPITGTVNSIKINPGSVIKPSETIMSIVPKNEPLQIEAQITPVDIGHIKIGDRAKIRIQAYDYSRYGIVTGKVKDLSATTFTDETTKTVFYKGIIQPDTQYVGQTANKLRPGMTAEVDIITGQKTIIEYLLKPIYTSLHSSFHER